MNSIYCESEQIRTREKKSSVRVCINCIFHPTLILHSFKGLKATAGVRKSREPVVWELFAEREAALRAGNEHRTRGNQRSSSYQIAQWKNRSAGWCRERGRSATSKRAIRKPSVPQNESPAPVASTACTRSAGTKSSAPLGSRKTTPTRPSVMIGTCK